MNTSSDDWGPALGQEDPTPSPKKVPRKESLSGLVYYFRNGLPVESMSRLSSPVNAPALMKAFKKLVAEGFTHTDIRSMIDDFCVRIKVKPLREDILPWRAFIGDLDSLAKSLKTKNPTESYGSWGLDSRLMED